ncbi:MAG: hypothetical protein U0835_20580 [Isosphaeraceae bacterium]
MRSSLNRCVIAAAAAVWLGGSAEAQQFGGRRTTPVSTSAVRAEPDLLTPYAPSNPRAEKGIRPYRRTPAPALAPAPADRVASSRGVGNYFPSMRAGQSPNQNVINPRTLCVPGRRAMLQR